MLDELAQVDPKEAGEIAYMLANGSGKARAGKNGAAKNPPGMAIIIFIGGRSRIGATHPRSG